MIVDAFIAFITMNALLCFYAVRILQRMSEMYLHIKTHCNSTVSAEQFARSSVVLDVA